jgi:hypothetical protein
VILPPILIPLFILILFLTLQFLERRWLNPCRELLYEVIALEDDFLHESHLDPAEWHALFVKFKRLNRHFLLAYTVEKLPV